MIGKKKKKKAPAQREFHVKRGDIVKVTSGASRGQEGKVLQILPKQNRVIVEGVNMVKKAARPTQINPKGGIEEREGALHVSNVKKVSEGEKAKKGKKE